jgi:hypothetical protein
MEHGSDPSEDDALVLNAPAPEADKHLRLSYPLLWFVQKLRLLYPCLIGANRGGNTSLSLWRTGASSL